MDHSKKRSFGSLGSNQNERGYPHSFRITLLQRTFGYFQIFWDPSGPFGSLPYLGKVACRRPHRPKKHPLSRIGFLGSGIIDTSLKYLENRFLSASEMPLFSATLFFAAASVGLFILAILVLRGSFQFQWKNVLGGLFLGIPNYFSVYFLLKALKSNVLESSGIFTVNNVGIVMLSTVAGIVLFHEKLLRKNWIGIGLAIASIALVAIARN